MCDEGCARRGGDAWWRVTAPRHWCRGVVRVQRGLRGAAVMWYRWRRSFMHARCGGGERMRRGGVSGGARLGGASRASLAQPVASLSDNAAKCAVRQRFARKFFSKRAPGIQGCCARAGRRGELRGAEMHNVFGLSLRVECLVSKVRGQSLVLGGLHSCATKLARVPKEAYLKSHPRNTLVVTAAQSAFFCSGTDAAATR